MEQTKQRAEELARFYLDTLALNDHLMQWYRALFLALEGTLFAAAFFIHEAELIQFLCVPATVGSLCCPLWATVCAQRGRLVDRQKKKLGDLKNRQEELDWDWYRIWEGEWERRLPRYTFNLFLPLAVGTLWVFIQSQFGAEGISYCIAEGILVILTLPAFFIFSYTKLGLPKGWD